MGALQQSKTMLVTTEFVLLEVADALSASQLRSRTVAYIEWLRRWSQVHIILADHQLLLDGWRLYSQRPDKDWGLTDCTSFVIMTHEHIGSAFTSDRHFQQAGFVKLL